MKSLSHVRLLVTPWTAAYQAPPSMGFSRQEYWSGVPLLSPVLCLHSPKCVLFYPCHQEYTIDITFCQSWYDERLRFNGSFESFVLSGNLVSLLWVPDTFFRNSKRTYEHSITMPNQMVRIHKDGKVLYTIRYVKLLESCLL